MLKQIAALFILALLLAIPQSLSLRNATQRCAWATAPFVGGFFIWIRYGRKFSGKSLQ